MDKKTCWGCKKDLPLTAFHKDKGKKSGYQSKCKSCQYERYLERLAADPSGVRAIANRSQQRHRRRRLYGITDAEFEGLIERQGGVCAVCRKVPPPKVNTHGGFVVDHDHGTGLVRGALCHNCNRSLGLLGDEPEILRRGADYIEAARFGRDRGAA